MRKEDIDAEAATLKAELDELIADYTEEATWDKRLNAALTQIIALVESTEAEAEDVDEKGVIGQLRTIVTDAEDVLKVVLAYAEVLNEHVNIHHENLAGVEDDELTLEHVSDWSSAITERQEKETKMDFERAKIRTAVSKLNQIKQKIEQILNLQTGGEEFKANAYADFAKVANDLNAYLDALKKRAAIGQGHKLLGLQQTIRNLNK